MPEIVKPPIKCLAMEKKRIKIGREAITAAAIITSLLSPPLRGS